MKFAMLLAALCLSTMTFAQWSSQPTYLSTTKDAVVGGTSVVTQVNSDETALDVTSVSSVFLGLYGNNSGGNYSSFYFTCSPAFEFAGFISGKKGSGTALPIVFSLDSGSGPSEKVRIATNGNVGIGTSNPQSKLAVNGTITAKEVVVTTTGWPDYVFQEDYQLMPLDQLEARITAEGKLPGVPSAAAIEAGGISLGEMQKTLMEKVEELTLYVLQLKHENDALKASLSQLNQSNNQ